jgi:membrane protein implicated in regulation of membrane protease activity
MKTIKYTFAVFMIVAGLALAGLAQFVLTPGDSLSLVCVSLLALAALVAGSRVLYETLTDTSHE